jgi:arylamine N-acetyltransferase
MTKQSTGNSQYTSTQVDQYLARIGFPIDKWPKVTLANASTEAGLTYLTKLQKYQISKVPFENLSLHYSKFPGLSLDKEDIFEKIVAKRKGGYCMELNYLFATILKTLGYEVIQTGARVYNPWNYSPPWGEPGGW